MMVGLILRWERALACGETLTRSDETLTRSATGGKADGDIGLHRGRNLRAGWWHHFPSTAFTSGVF